MSTSDSEQYNLLDQLAEEFAARFRRGERPALKEYTDRYPELAAEIRELFPALVKVEQVDEGQINRESELKTGGPANSVQQIGDYRIVGEIGRGGMGIVYEAEQVSLGRRVALKVLPRHVAADRTTLERFRREARAAARLHHTNIVPVIEVGQDGDVREERTTSEPASAACYRRHRGPGGATLRWVTAKCSLSKTRKTNLKGPLSKRLAINIYEYSYSRLRVRRRLLRGHVAGSSRVEADRCHRSRC
jgi:serine/threonine protein kinase